jgi:hypothetical protein
VYRSPEYAAAKRDRDSNKVLAPDVRMDLWGVAVTLYELLTGQLPFGANGEGTVASVFDALQVRPGAAPRIVLHCHWPPLAVIPSGFTQ